MTYRLASLLMLVLTGLPLVARAEVPTTSTLFDPARHMHVSEVHPGMTGYGLSVFKGTQIEKFNVEVVSVLKNFNPKSDVVLIRCTGDYLKHTGSIAGMSGSPIFLKDDSGRYRMIGAFAYGWPMTKDPLAGVQPIEYMLKLPAARSSTETAEARATTQPSGGTAGLNSGRHGLMSWSLLNAGFVPFWKPLIASRGSAESDGLNASPRLGMSSDPPQLQPLTTPLMTSGMSPSVLKVAEPLFRAFGMTALQAGGSSGSDPGSYADARLEPGSVLAVPLLTGDMDMTAIGTVTEVIGNRVFGFGHPFNNEGYVSLPMGAGKINGVIPNMQTSFKLGSLTRDVGSLNADQSVGVAGQVGRLARTIPLEFHVRYADGSPPRTYKFQAAIHSKFTPMLAGLALGAAITGPSELPQYNTVDYELKLQFANGQTVTVANKAVNANMQELFGEIGLPLMAASENPFERIPVEKITGDIKIAPTARQAQILEVNVPRSRYRPGETVQAFVAYKPFREPEAILPVTLELPHDLPQGTYQLIISDAQRYFQDEQQTEPFRFTADNVKEVFGVLKDVAAIRQNAVYLRLLRQPDGVAVGRVALPQLPSSRRQILLGAGRSNITPFVSSTVKFVPTDMVMNGSAEFAITIDPKARVEVPGPKGHEKTRATAAAPSAQTRTPAVEEAPVASTEKESNPKASK